jgi:SAM-dependent methyltransferase
MRGPVCQLCGSPETRAHFRGKSRDYFLCAGCRLIFVSPSQFISEKQEKERYDLHRNRPDDQGYRRFLSRLLIPMQARLPNGSSGLDFGSGPCPVLSMMFREAGQSVDLYDRYYADDRALLMRQYDFITAAEVVEHLRQPREELDRLWRCLKPGGLLGIMTELSPSKGRFESWHYRKDITHICFYSRETFEWLARLWNAELEFAGENVMLLKKKTRE